MTFINYKFADGHVESIEVTAEFAEAYRELVRGERRLYRKETRRHLSLDMLMENEERENNQGSLENKSLRRNQETFSIISPELDPLEVIIRKEAKESRPIFEALSLGLTDYQRKIAVEFYINSKTQTQIANELGIVRMSVCNILKKVRKKVLQNFT